MQGKSGVEAALQALGELLAARGESVAIVVVGGSALNLLGITDRPTTDVDVIALGAPGGPGTPTSLVEPNADWPHLIQDLVHLVARTHGLNPGWLNAAVAGQWKLGLPDGFASRVTWRKYGGLVVGLAGHQDLVALKLYASADQTGPDSVHFQDLIRLRPTPHELASAQTWVLQQDPGIEPQVRAVIQHVSATR